MKKGKKLSCEALAKFFMEKSDKENVISDIFDFLGVDCLVRRHVDMRELDALIMEFNKSYKVETLSSIISLIQNGKKETLIDEKDFLTEIKKYIADHFMEDTTIEQVALDLHVSYYYLCHFVKQYMGQSLNHYRTLKRLGKAMRMLLQTEIKISDIALECGFNNSSYFTETFVKHVGETPSDFREKHKDVVVHDFYEFEDILLALKIPCLTFLDNCESVGENKGIPYKTIYEPNEKYGKFLHEAAIIEYEGVLYASWYNCKEKELIGVTPIREIRSYDGGKTWTEPNVIATDESGKIMFCPPVYGICDGKLYLLLNQMVAADYIHSLDLYVLDKKTDKFIRLWSRPIPFKLNTNIVSLPNGKLLLPGRMGEIDGFPITPAVLISDSGKIDAEWRLVKVSPNGKLPAGADLLYPETTVFSCNDVLYMFNRNDKRNVPLVYTSSDFGEHWSEVNSHDIPYRSTKIYAGNLSDGRAYVIANTENQDRSKLVLFVSKKGTPKFNKQLVLFDKRFDKTDMYECHYPSAVESNGKLYIITTAGYNGKELNGKGSVVFTVDLGNI